MERALIPMNGEGSSKGATLSIQDKDFVVTAVSMGNPHCINFVEDMNQVQLSLWGPEIEKHSLFPAKTNVEFAQVLNRNEIIMRVWERGAGITLACGTGACATLVAAVLNGLTDRSAVLHLQGGDLFIQWNEEDGHVYMTGPAREVFTGKIDLEKI